MEQVDPFNTPLMPPPNGGLPDFNAPKTDIQVRITEVMIGTLVAATFLVVLRVWTRLRVVKSPGLDDAALLAAWGTSIGLSAVTVEWMKHGFGQHMWNVSLAEFQQYTSIATPAVTLYVWAPALTKFSILLLYRRLDPQEWFHWTIYGVMAVIALYTLPITILFVAVCKASDSGAAQCLNVLGIVQGIFNIVTDFVVVVLPLPMIIALQVPRGQKVALGFILATGSFVVVASIYRLVFIQGIRSKLDQTYWQCAACVWSFIEINFGIMCSCLTVLKPFLVRYFGPAVRFLSLEFSKRSSKNKSNSMVSANHRWSKRGSYPLGSMERVRTQDSTKYGDIPVVITTSICTEEHAGNTGDERGGYRDFERESQKDIIDKRMRSAYP